MFKAMLFIVGIAAFAVLIGGVIAHGACRGKRFW